MDEKKIIDAIYTFGSPIWEATRRKEIFEGMLLLVVGAVLLVAVLLLRTSSFEAGMMEALNFDKESKDKYLYYFILFVVFVVGAAFIFGGIEVLVAIDYFAYKSLLP